MRKPKNRSTAEVKADIRHAIDTRYQPGWLLPTRRDMTDEYGASTHTIQRALRELEAEGIVIIRPSVGTIVAPNSETGPQLINRAATGRIYPPGQYAAFTYCGLAVPPEEVAEAFALADGQEAIVRQRQRKNAEGLVLSSSESWYHPRHADTAPRLLLSERIVEGSFVYLMQKSELRPAPRGEDVWIISRPASDDEKETLALDESQIVMVERTVIKAVGGEYIEYGISSRPGHVPYPVRVQSPPNL